MLDRTSDEGGGAAQTGALHPDERQERLLMPVAQISPDDPRGNDPLHDSAVSFQYTTWALPAGPIALASGEVGSFVAPAGGRNRKHIIRATTNVLTIVDNEGTLIWNAGLSRTHNLTTSSEEDDIIFEPEMRIRVAAYAGHDGLVFRCNQVASHEDFVRAISNNKPTPPRSVDLILAYGPQY